MRFSKWAKVSSFIFMKCMLSSFAKSCQKSGRVNSRDFCFNSSKLKGPSESSSAEVGKLGTTALISGESDEPADTSG